MIAITSNNRSGGIRGVVRGRTGICEFGVKTNAALNSQPHSEKITGMFNPVTAKPAILSILLCLMPDDFTRQWGTPGSQWVNHSLKNVPLQLFHSFGHLRYSSNSVRYARRMK